MAIVKDVHQHGDVEEHKTASDSVKTSECALDWTNKDGQPQVAIAELLFSLFGKQVLHLLFHLFIGYVHETRNLSIAFLDRQPSFTNEDPFLLGLQVMNDDELEEPRGAVTSS